MRDASKRAFISPSLYQTIKKILDTKDMHLRYCFIALWIHYLRFVLVQAQLNDVFEVEDPETALESTIDGKLKGSYPMEDVHKVAPFYLQDLLA